MEKVTVRIGRPMLDYKEATEAHTADNAFLVEALDIGPKRASDLLIDLRIQCCGSKRSQYLHLDMTYEQLGKYSALRRMPVDHVNYWLCPKIMELIQDDKPVYVPEHKPIEVRPGYRKRS
jgi:hypothetical protein